MPKPSKGESKKDYVSRCIPMVIGEGKPPKEAAGKCYGMYDFYKKKSKKKKNKKNESLTLPKFSEFITENVIQEPIKENLKFFGLVEINVNGEKKYVPVYDK